MPLVATEGALVPPRSPDGVDAPTARTALAGVALGADHNLLAVRECLMQQELLEAEMPPREHTARRLGPEDASPERPRGLACSGACFRF